MKKRKIFRSFLAMALVVCMVGSALPMWAMAAEGEDDFTKTGTLTGGEVVITITPNGENSNKIDVTGTNADGSALNLNGTSVSSTTGEGTDAESTTTTTNLTGTETNGSTVKDVTYQETTTTTTTTDEDGTVSTQTTTTGSESKEWDVEEDDKGDAPVDVPLKPGESTSAQNKVEGSETSETTTEEDGTVKTESGYEADRTVNAETSDITTETTKNTTDMQSCINIGVNYNTDGSGGKIRWDYYVESEDGTFAWAPIKPLNSSQNFDGIMVTENGKTELRIYPRFPRTAEQMPEWLKGYYHLVDGMYIPNNNNKAEDGGPDGDYNQYIDETDVQYAFSGYGALTQYSLLLDADGTLRWSERYVDKDGDGIPESLVKEYINSGRVADADGNVFYVYCMDADTGTLEGTTYVLENIHDADYFLGTEEEQQLAKEQVEAIVLNGFWGDTSSQQIGSLETIKKNLREFINNSTDFTFTYTDPSAYMGGEATTESRTYTMADKEEMLRLVDLLDEAGALAVTQSAIWEYGNRGSNDPIMVFNRFNDNKDINYAMALYRAYLLSDDLREQVKNSEEDKATTIYDSDSFIDENSLKLTVGEKVETLEFNTVNTDNDDTNDVYNNSLSFSLVVAPNEHDNLVVYLVGNDGIIRCKGRIAGDGDPDEFREFNNGIEFEIGADGVYSFKNVPMQEGSDITFDLQLDGVQHLERGVYIFKSSTGDYDDAQTLVGIAQGEHQVNVSSKFTFNFSVDETNRYYSKTTWSSTGDPSEKTEEEEEEKEEEEKGEIIFEEFIPLDEFIQEEEIPMEELPEEEIPLEELPDEEIPLADVPQTGDNSIIFAIIFALSFTGLLALALTKKREEA